MALKVYPTWVLIFLFASMAMAKPGLAWFKVGLNGTRILLDNDEPTPDVIGYVLWVDLDGAGEGGQAFHVLSWTLEGWTKGIRPVSTKPTTAPRIRGFDVAPLPRPCPRGHRCFLVGVLASDVLQAPLLSVYPLSDEATYERFPGQWRFKNRVSDTALPGSTPLVEAQGEGLSAKEGNDNPSPSIEKPDLYKLVNGDGAMPNLLLMAISRAHRLVVVNLDDPMHPVVEKRVVIPGDPKEIYELGREFLVLSSGDNETYVTQLTWQSVGITKVDGISIRGGLVESRRRGTLIYAVTEGSGSGEPVPLLEADTPSGRSVVREGEAWVHAIGISGEGGLRSIATRAIPLRPRIVAICPDFLSLVQSDPSSTTIRDAVTVIPISTGIGLEPLDTAYRLYVDGHIPSDRHMGCIERDGASYLAVLASPVWGQEGAGTSLHVYQIGGLDAGERGNAPRLCGTLQGIAPGEALYGAVITGERAYAVTYRRKDPLWVIDLAHPCSPQVVGELELPGWSEKLFFHKERLLSLGYLDVEPGALRPIRLVSVGLFDCSIPGAPRLLTRLTPFLGETDYSWSGALVDERAFFRQWDNGLFSFPLEAYSFHEDGQGIYWVQAASVRHDRLIDMGIASIPFGANRAVWTDGTHLAAFSHRELVPLRSNGEGNLTKGQPVPLIKAMDRLVDLDEATALGISVYERIYALYHLRKDLIEWGMDEGEYASRMGVEIESGFSDLAMERGGSDLLLFNRADPLKIAFVSGLKGAGPSFHGPYTIELGHGELYTLHGGPFLSRGLILFPAISYRNGIEEYRAYLVHQDSLGQGHPLRPRALSIPGIPVDMEGRTLYTVEPGEYNAHRSRHRGLRVNVLEVQDEQAVLLKTKVFEDCDYWGGVSYVDQGRLYLMCGSNGYHIEPMEVGEEVGAGMAPTAGGAESMPIQNDSKAKVKVISLDERLTDLGDYPVGPRESLVKVDSKRSLMLTRATPMPYGTLEARNAAVWWSPQCTLYDISSPGHPRELAKFNIRGCGDATKVLFTDHGLLVAQGEEGVRFVGYGK